MKAGNIFLSVVFMVVYSLGFAQTKDDLIDIIEAVSELREVAPLFQSEVSGGPALVLLRPRDRDGGQGTAYDNRLFYDLRDEDFSFSRRPIMIIAEGEASQYGLDPSYLTSVSYKLEQDDASLMLSSGLIEGDGFFQGSFSLHKDFGSWEVTGKNVQIR